MRRKEREVTQRAQIEAIMRACKVCRLSINGEDGTPYIVPMNFGYGWEGNLPVLYMHCAQEGRKLGLLRRDARVGFEMDCMHGVTGGESACSYTCRFSSIIGTGDCEIVTNDAEKEIGLHYLMECVTGKRFDGFEKTWFDRTHVLRVRVDGMTAKACL